MKIAIYADPLMGKGGASYLTLELAKSLNADIITSGFNKEILSNSKMSGKIIDIGNILIRLNYSLGYLFEAPLRFIFYKNYNYDINIFIGTFSIFASQYGQKNMWLCLTPNRIMYDLNKLKLSDRNVLKRLVYLTHVFLFKQKDQSTVAKNISRIVSQNFNVQARVKRYYGRNSDIIYSSIITSKYKFISFEDYFLAVSRLVPEKRIDLIARAFTKMPHKKLIIVGEGPEKEKIRNITNNYGNIKLLSNVDDMQLTDLYSRCLATIYLPLNEDFGLVPLEGMASGKACIAVNEGGCRETVIPGKTGVLIKPNELAIISAVQQYNLKTARSMKNECIEWSKKFDINSYMKQWKRIINIRQED